MLSVFGWKLIITNIEENQKKLFCEFCGRFIQLTFYKTLKGTNQKMQEIYHEEEKSFDLLGEHRYFCKWGKFDKNGVKIYGWNICFNFLHEQLTKDSETVSLIDKKNEISRIKYEILKTAEDMKKIKDETLNKFDEICKLSEKYELSDADLLKEVIKNRRQNLKEFYDEIGNSIENPPVKKIKLS